MSTDGEAEKNARNDPRSTAESGPKGCIVELCSHHQMETPELATSKSRHGGSGQNGMDD